MPHHICMTFSFAQRVTLLNNYFICDLYWSWWAATFLLCWVTQGCGCDCKVHWWHGTDICWTWTSTELVSIYMSSMSQLYWCRKNCWIMLSCDIVQQSWNIYAIIQQNKVVAVIYQCDNSTFNHSLEVPNRPRLDNLEGKTRPITGPWLLAADVSWFLRHTNEPFDIHQFKFQGGLTNDGINARGSTVVHQFQWGVHCSEGH